MKMDIDKKVNMSLDDIMKQNSKQNKRRINRNSNRNNNKNKNNNNGNSSNNNGNRSIKSRLSRGNNGIKKSNIPRGNINGKWKHDLFSSNNSRKATLKENEGRDRIQSRLSRIGLVTAKNNFTTIDQPKPIENTSTIQITNLHPNANTEDIKTIFSEFGEIVNILLKRDVSGHSTGVCEIEYADRKSSIAAISKFNGVIADGQKLYVAEIQKSFSIAGTARPNISSTNQRGKISVKGMYADRIEEPKKSTVLNRSNSKTKFHISL